MQDDVLKKWPANEHDEPVAVEGDAFAGRGDVIEIFNAVTEPDPDGLQAIEQDQKNLGSLKLAHVFQVFGEAGVDVITLDAERIG